MLLTVNYSLSRFVLFALTKCPDDNLGLGFSSRRFVVIYYTLHAAFTDVQESSWHAREGSEFCHEIMRIVSPIVFNK